MVLWEDVRREKTRRISDGGYSGFVRGWMGSAMGDCWIPVKDTVCEILNNPWFLVTSSIQCR